jgi:DNA-binding IclR family transcriptional regulator
MDDAKHLEQILTKLNKRPATAADLASSLGLSKGEVSRLLAALDADDKIVKFADRDEWFLLLDAVPGP